MALLCNYFNNSEAECVCGFVILYFIAKWMLYLHNNLDVGGIIV
jgi:hypothetical protein